MADRTSIEWATATLNPIRARNKATGKVGWHCEHVSPACEYCYAEAQNRNGARGGTRLPYKPGHRADGEIFLDEETLTRPLHWRKPRRIFWGSMTDLFGDWVPDAWLDRIFAVMALTPQHTHLVLTKHSKRMRDYVDKLGRAWILRLSHAINAVPELIAAADRPGRETPHWPLPNVHFGVTAEDQPRADERIPNLLATPAAIRFVSAEPLLADIDFTSLPSVSGIGRHLDALSTAGAKFSDLPGRIDQIITGGETGPRARGTPIAAFRSIRDQCAAAGVAYFHKHNGEWIDADEWYDLVDQGAVEIVTRFGRLRGHVCDGRGAFADWAPARPLNFEDAEALAEITGVRRLEHQSDGTTLLRVGARRAGRALGGRVYDEFPEPRR